MFIFSIFIIVKFAFTILLKVDNKVNYKMCVTFQKNPCKL